jgi:hypothetical protein
MGLTPKPDGNYHGLCPAHKDTNKSMSVKIADDGKVVIKCFAGCPAVTIVELLGSTMSDCYPPAGSEVRPPPPNIVATYDYKDEGGKLLYQVCRTDPKGFRQRQPADGGGWTWNLKNVREVLYRLPELIVSAPRPVIVVEGEKDCDNVRKLGFVATACTNGADGWRQEYLEFLKDRCVIVLRDNDDAGYRFAVDVAATVRGALIVTPPVAEKGDVSDWITAGGTPKQLGELIIGASEARCLETYEWHERLLKK